MQIAHLYQSGAENHIQGVLIKLAAGFNGKIVNHGNEFRGVIISGKVNYGIAGNSAQNTLCFGKVRLL